MCTSLAVVGVCVAAAAVSPNLVTVCGGVVVFFHTTCTEFATYESVACVQIGCLMTWQACTLPLSCLLLLSLSSLACGHGAYHLLFLYVRVSSQWHAPLPSILLSAVLAASSCVSLFPGGSRCDLLWTCTL